jgi:phosphatidate cytidylyltransferase
LNSFLKRSITGFSFVALTTLLILLSDYSLLLLLLLFNITAQKEFFKILETEKSKPIKSYSYITGSFFIILCFLYFKYSIDNNIFWLILIPIMFIFIKELFSSNDFPIKNISYSFLSLIYISLPLSLSFFVIYDNPYFSNQNYNPEILLGIFVLLWIYDSMAYCVGVPFGKHRLFERVSPKKSWEGAIGGAILTIIASGFFNIFIPEIPLIQWIIIASIVVIFGTIGDLIESLFKRSVNIKDSGNILPGHGGILDRIDSFLFVNPWIWIFFSISKII